MASNKEILELAKEISKTFEKNRAVENAEKAWQSFGVAMSKPIQDMMKLTNAAAKVYEFGAKTAEMGDEAVKTAEKLGITTQAYGELAYAAKQSGVSNETFSSSMIALDKNIQATVKGDENLQSTFKQVGVSIYDTNGKLKNTEQIMTEVSDEFAKMPQSVEKTNLAMTLFGESGSQMIPMMEKGSVAINKLREKAVKLGLTFDKVDGLRATRFVESIAEAKDVIMGLGITIGKQLHEPLAIATEKFSAFIMANREMIGTKVAEYVKKISDYFSDTQNMEKFKSFLTKAKDALVYVVNGIKSFIEVNGGLEETIKKVFVAWAAFRIGKIVFDIGNVAVATSVLIGTFAESIPILTEFGKTALTFVKDVALGSVGAIKNMVFTLNSLTATVKSVTFNGLITGIGNMKSTMFYVAKAAGTTFVGGIKAMSIAMFTGVKAALSLTGALLTCPITWIVAGIVAIGVAIFLLEKKFKLFSTAFKAVGAFFKEEISKIKEAFSKGFLTGIANVIVRLVTLVPRLFASVGKAVLPIFGDMFSSLGEIISTGITNIKNWFINMFFSLGDIISAGITNIKNWFINVFSSLGDIISAGITNIKNWFINMFSSLGDIVSVGIENIKNWFIGGFDKIKEMFSGGFIDGIKNLFSGIIGFIVNIGKDIVKAFNDAIIDVFGIDLLAMGKDWFQNFINGILSAINNAKTFIQNAVSGLIPDWVKTTFGVKNTVTQSTAKFADGGIVTSPQIAMVGEAGPEAIIPLSKPTRATQIVQQIQMMQPMAQRLSNVVNNSRSDNTGGTETFNFSPNITVMGDGDPSAVKSAVSDALSQTKYMFEKWYAEHNRQLARVSIS